MPLRRLTIVAAGGTWVVRAGGAVIGESARAIELSRNGRPAMILFPREDLGMAFLEASPETRPDGALGPARYFGIVTKSGVLADAAWSYETPPPEAERIAGLIGFDTDRVAVEEI
jgi:uncharacterized protein (DUF427 family)